MRDQVRNHFTERNLPTNLNTTSGKTMFRNAHTPDKSLAAPRTLLLRTREKSKVVSATSRQAFRGTDCLVRGAWPVEILPFYPRRGSNFALDTPRKRPISPVLKKSSRSY